MPAGNLLSCAGQRLTRSPLPPSWWFHRDGEPVVGDFKVAPTDAEWSPGTDPATYSSEVGNRLAYVDAGQIFLGDVISAQKHTLTLQDVKVVREGPKPKLKKKANGRGRKKFGKTKFVLVPLFLSPDGSITKEASNGQPLSYHVNLQQILGDAKNFLSDPRLVIADEV